MSRKRPINWRESDAEKLAREVERFNAKIYRAKSRHPEIADILPNTIKKEDKAKLIEELKIKPRSEFNKTINSLDRFTRRGAEQEIVSKTGNRVTRWEKNEVAMKVAQINRERTIERKKVEAMEATSRGEKIGLKRGEMGSERLNELQPKKFDFDKIKGGKEWERFKASVNKQASPEARDTRKELFKENYLKALDSVYGDYASDIKSLIEALPADVVVDTYYREQEASIDFHYDKIEMDFKLEILDGIWQGVSDEYNELRG
jgi:hypothetical protein